MNHRKINWPETKKNLISYLSNEMLPFSYRYLFEHPCLIVKMENEFFGCKTKPIEKFRQYLSDTERDEFFYAKGGLVFLRRWFPDKQQLIGLPFMSDLKIDGDVLVSFDAGYEYCQRESFLHDWQNNKGTEFKYNRNRKALLLEHHVKSYFKNKFPFAYREPSNKGKFSTHAADDFSFELFGFKFLVDVKSYSYKKSNGSSVAVIRNPKPNIIYLFGDVLDEKTIIINGVAGGGWLSLLGWSNSFSGLTHIERKHTHNIECLLVMLNMAYQEKNYIKYYQMFEERYNNLQVVT